jgi:hypothetical protein
VVPFFENDVQYINRIQRPKWLKLFRMAGLELIEEQNEMEDLTGLNVASIYKNLVKRSSIWRIENDFVKAFVNILNDNNPFYMKHYSF